MLCLTSSSEYLQALREGKYLLFLEWIDFIAQKYNCTNYLIADDAENFLIYEWLSSGYKEVDAQNIVTLYAVYDLESKPLRGKLDYALKSIVIALFICMVFQKHHLSSQVQ
ncbi:MAG: hypothetical protein ACRCXC_11915 [Legionella sp.]